MMQTPGLRSKILKDSGCFLAIICFSQPSLIACAFLLTVRQQHQRHIYATLLNFLLSPNSDGGFHDISILLSFHIMEYSGLACGFTIDRYM